MGARAEEAPTSPPVARRVLEALFSSEFESVQAGPEGHSLHLFHLIGVEFRSYSLGSAMGKTVMSSEHLRMVGEKGKDIYVHWRSN